MKVHTSCRMSVYLPYIDYLSDHGDVVSFCSKIARFDSFLKSFFMFL